MRLSDLHSSVHGAGSAVSAWRKLGANDMLIFSVIYNQTERVQWEDAIVFVTHVLPVMEDGAVVCILGLHYPYHKHFGPGQAVIKAALQHSHLYSVLHISDGVIVVQRKPKVAHGQGAVAQVLAESATTFDNLWDESEDEVWTTPRENVVITCGGHDSIGSTTTVIKSLASNIVGDAIQVHIYLVTSPMDWADIQDFRESIHRRYRNIHLHFLDIASEVYLAERLVNLTSFNHTHPSGIWGLSKMFLPDRMLQAGVSNFMLLDDDILLLGTIHEFFKASRAAVKKHDHDEAGAKQEGFGSFMAMGCLYDPERIDSYCNKQNRPHNCHPTDYCSSAPWYFDLDRFRKAKYSLKDLLPDATQMADYEQNMATSHDQGRMRGQSRSFAEIIWYITKDMVREYPDAVYEVSDQEVFNRMHRLNPRWTAAMPCEWLCFKGQGMRPAGGCHERCRLLHYASDSFFDKDHFWGFPGLWTKYQSKSPLPFRIPGITSDKERPLSPALSKMPSLSGSVKDAIMAETDSQLEKRIKALHTMNSNAGNRNDQLQQAEKSFLDTFILNKK